MTTDVFIFMYFMLLLIVICCEALLSTSWGAS